MRSAALAACLVLALGAGPALAGVPPPSGYEPPAGAGYHEVTETPQVLADGELRASVLANTLRPQRGYTPLEVVLQNTGPAPRPVRLSFRGMSGNRTTSRTVEVAPGQRLSTFLLVPAIVSAGSLSLESPGVEAHPASTYLEGNSRASVLVLGTQALFDAATAVPKAERAAPRFSARFLDSRDAPRELAAYAGYDAVVVAEDPVAPEVWPVLEAYAATGGHLVLTRPPRDMAERLPLLAGTFSGELHPYGFGLVRRCTGSAQACGTVLQADLLGTKAAVQPAGPPPRWERRTQVLKDGQQPLLNNARAPLGRFLGVIFLFTLAVGPGGLLLARRKGPVALLVAVPGVALVTCLAIVADSVLVDGFGVHASRYSYTWLDRARSRAVTVGLGAWYANLPPGRVALPATSALLAPEDVQDALVDVDWTSGMGVTSGFLPSRTYREWGEVAVVPTRARLVVKREGGTVRVQNALGAALAFGAVKLEGRTYALPELADGAEGVATPAAADSAVQSVDSFLSLPEAPQRRFGFDREGLLEPLTEGGFVARLSGAGFSPAGTALPMQLHEGVHLVRGTVDGP